MPGEARHEADIEALDLAVRRARFRVVYASYLVLRMAKAFPGVVSAAALFVSGTEPHKGLRLN